MNDLQPCSFKSAGAWSDPSPLAAESNEGATLGRVLFYDKRLSSTNTHSCSSCHQQQHDFATPARFSAGATGEQSSRNAMGLTNVRYNETTLYFSDMRVRTLETLALLPIQDHKELANSLPNLVGKLSATDFYPALFASAFGTAEITPERISMALSQFLRSLISYRSRLDSGVFDPNGAEGFPYPLTTLTAQENEGSAIFHNFRCDFCHHNTVFTMFLASNNGLDTIPADTGFGGGEFRAASLRNIRQSAPYMHDGRFATLRDVIEFYDQGIQASSGLDGMLRSTDGVSPRRMNLTESQKDALEAFLDVLTDEAMLNDPKFSDPFN